MGLGVFVVPAHAKIYSGGTSFAATCAAASKSLPSKIFVPWYKYLPTETDSTGNCGATLYKDSNDKPVLLKSIILVLIAVIELLTRIAALVAVGFIIYGSVQYITSQGEPGSISNAKSTITNALIGFVIVVLAIAIIQFLGRSVS